ncbi:acetyltransferase, GNAT family protein [Phlegmacium glaucopus]|nr:acetyltransferase, GNAT family protein [Phlegmacium glaucopus]
MTQVEIRTPRLLLREARQDDLDAFHECFCDPETMNFWSTAAHTSLSQTQTFLDSMIGSPYNGVLDFTVCLLEISESTSSSEQQIVIGKAGVWNGEEIGFIFNRAYWGKGYAFEALSAIMQQYWSTRKTPENVDKVTVKADVDPRNKPCLNLLNRLGFQVVGHGERTFETHLGWCDSVYLEAQ